MSSGSKYLKRIGDNENLTDVYDILDSHDVSCPARQHAIKKLLFAGIRGKADTLQDLREALDAVSRAISLEERRSLDTEEVVMVLTDVQYSKPKSVPRKRKPRK